jgi:hypothetical protein
VFLDSVPGARRILRRLEHHGWTGWTNIRRIQSTRRQPSPGTDQAATSRPTGA